jgi:hypothetical protein
MSDELLALTAAQAVERIRSGDLRSTEVFDAYRTRAAADDLNAFVWVAEDTPAAAGEDAPLAGVPVAVKDLFCTEGIPSQAGSKILEGYRPPYTSTVVRNLQEAGLADPRQDQPGRVRDGLVERELRLRAGAQPVGPRPRPRRVERRQRRRGRRRPRAVGDRHRHRRLDPPARRAVRDRRAQAHVRQLLALRDDRLRVVARPGRARSRATSPTRRCCSATWSDRTRATRRPCSSRKRSGFRAPSASTASASACPRTSPARASSRGSWRASRRRCAAPQSSARRSSASRCPTPTTG